MNVGLIFVASGSSWKNMRMVSLWFLSIYIFTTQLFVVVSLGVSIWSLWCSTWFEDGITINHRCFFDCGCNLPCN